MQLDLAIQIGSDELMGSAIQPGSRREGLGGPDELGNAGGLGDPDRLREIDRLGDPARSG